MPLNHSEVLLLLNNLRDFRSLNSCSYYDFCSHLTPFSLLYKDKRKVKQSKYYV